MVSQETIDVMVTGGLYGVARGDHNDFGLSWYACDDVTLRGLSFRDGTAQAMHRKLDNSTADQVGAMLWAANRESVDYRYDESELEHLYVFRHHVGFRPTAVEVLSAIGCYRYQSCEHPGWPASEACSFIDSLTHKAIGALDGYRDAPYDWSAAHIAARRYGVTR